MRINACLKNAVVQIISDDPENEDDIVATLGGRGFVIERAGVGLRIDTAGQCDVGLIAVRRSCGWSAGVITALRSSETTCAALVLLSTGGPQDVMQSLRAGAVDCLVKPAPLPVLLEALGAAVACTHRWRDRILTASETPAHLSVAIPTAQAAVFEPGPEQRLLRSPQPPMPCGRGPTGQIFSEPPVGTEDTEPRIDVVVARLADEKQLTPREREVLYWLLQGHRYEDIAIVLGVAPRTAKFHAANVLRKLNLDSRYDLPRLLAQGT